MSIDLIQCCIFRFLKVFKVNYVVEEEHALAGPGKTAPWMTFNGCNYGDSQACINILAEKLNIDPYPGMSEGEIATSKAFQAIIEDRLIPMMALERFNFFNHDDFNDINPSFVPRPARILRNLIWRAFAKKLKKANPRYANMSNEKTAEATCEIWQNFANLLGNNKYFFGNDQITLLDIIVFGYTTQILYMQPVGSKIRFKAETIEKMVEHNRNVKKVAFPDWDDLLASKPK